MDLLLWLSFRRNKTLKAWMQEQYSRDELHELSTPDYNVYLGGTSAFVNSRKKWEFRRLVIALYERYELCIWTSVGKEYDSQTDPTYLGCFGRLPHSGQVIDDYSFREFMVRNALRITASEMVT